LFQNNLNILRYNSAEIIFSIMLWQWLSPFDAQSLRTMKNDSMQPTISPVSRMTLDPSLLRLAFIPSHLSMHRPLSGFSYESISSRSYLLLI
jgi:hypothetical protein